MVNGCNIYADINSDRISNMKKFKVIIILATSMIISFSAVSAENDITVVGGVEMAEVQNSTAFNHVKKKLGKWEGKLTQGLTGAVYDASYEFELTSGGNTITETVIEDGVQMLTTYSDNDGELVIKHYCVLGTEPIFKVDTLSKKAIAIKLDKSKSNLHAEHENFVTDMKWTMNSKDSMTFEATVMFNGDLTKNKAKLKRVY